MLIKDLIASTLYFILILSGHFLSTNSLCPHHLMLKQGQADLGW